MNLNDWTRAEFEALPVRDWQDTTGVYHSLVLLPKRRVHDSGYRGIDFALIGDERQERTGGSSDALHLEGFGGYGKWESSLPVMRKPAAWNIDCLKRSGLIRLWSRNGFVTGLTLSSFEVYKKEAA